MFIVMLNRVVVAVIRWVLMCSPLRRRRRRRLD
jgi:hypothetical protein